jgi:hypothetical protein
MLRSCALCEAEYACYVPEATKRISIKFGIVVYKRNHQKQIYSFNSNTFQYDVLQIKTADSLVTMGTVSEITGF